MTVNLDKLAAQSLVYIDTGLDDGKELIFSKEKFAELIVQECVEIVEPCKCGCCDGEVEQTIATAIIKQIREHFGVEE